MKKVHIIQYYTNITIVFISHHKQQKLYFSASSTKVIYENNIISGM